MDTTFFLKGCVLGFSIAAPVGPIGLLTLRRSLASGMFAGFLTGLGAACADFVYGTVAACGLTLLAAGPWIEPLGGAFLVVLGLRIAWKHPAGNAALPSSPDALRSFAATFALTLTNPMTILSFTGMFAGLGVAASGRGSAVPVACGVFAGSAAWWLLLSAAGAVARRRIGPRQLAWIERGAGLIVAAFGLRALAH
jgi:threonine/homoserine/homoserine lactone efflux protein